MIYDNRYLTQSLSVRVIKESLPKEVTDLVDTLMKTVDISSVYDSLKSKFDRFVEFPDGTSTTIQELITNRTIDLGIEHRRGDAVVVITTSKSCMAGLHVTSKGNLYVVSSSRKSSIEIYSPFGQFLGCSQEELIVACKLLNVLVELSRYEFSMKADVYYDLPHPEADGYVHKHLRPLHKEKMHQHQYRFIDDYVAFGDVAASYEFHNPFEGKDFLAMEILTYVNRLMSIPYLKAIYSGNRLDAPDPHHTMDLDSPYVNNVVGCMKFMFCEEDLGSLIDAEKFDKFISDFIVSLYPSRECS